MRTELIEKSAARAADGLARAGRRLQPGDLAPAGVALDVNGQPVSLETLWPAGPTLLTFLRHFG